MEKQKNLTLKQLAEIRDYDDFQKNVLIVFHQLCDAAENNPEGLNIHGGLCEVSIDGKIYQTQLSFVCDDKLWTNETGVTFSERI
jgi:tricorn protease-like protein